MIKQGKQKIMIILFCLLPITVSSFAQTKTDTLKAFFTRLTTALNTSDTSLIITDLNADFSVSVASYPASRWYLNRVFESKRIQSVHFESIKSLGGDTVLVNTTINTQDGKIVESIAAFDKENKLLFIDYFDCFFSPSRYAKSEKQAELPFLLRNGSIILPIKLNGNPQTLYFLLDTGADGMAIRKSLGDSLNLSVSRTQNTSVVGGNMQVSISSGNTVHLSDSLALKDQSIAMFENMGDGTDGIIGLNLAKRYIVNLNFDTQQLSLFTFGNYKFEKEGETIPITIPSGVIMVPAVLNIVGKKEVSGDFVFDSGAHYHVIAFEAFVRKNRLLLSGFKSEEQASTVSLGVSSPVFRGKAFSFRFGKNIELHNMPITLQASTGRSSVISSNVDGSIGIELLSQFNITIDLLRKLVHLSPNGRINE